MTIISLLWANLWRSKFRTICTVLSILLAFVLYALLMGWRYQLSATGEVASEVQVVVFNKYARREGLPISHYNKIKQVSGIEFVGYNGISLHAYYQEPKQYFGPHAINDLDYFGTHPEIRVPQEQLDNWMANPAGLSVGISLAERYNLKIGDRVPLNSRNGSKSDGSKVWEFTVEAIHINEDHPNATWAALAHYNYINQSRVEHKDIVDAFLLKASDPDEVNRIANEVDALFKNSANETTSTPMDLLVREMRSQFIDISTISSSILVAVFISLLLVVNSTTTQVARERHQEYAALRAIGFSNKKLAILFIEEGILLTLIGAALGLALSQGFAWGARLYFEDFGTFYIPANDVLLGLFIALGFGALGTALSARELYQLDITSALRKE